jgi:nitrite reductase/ring-hydroxylating ferredoxin subunit
MEDEYTRVCKVSELIESRGKRFLINDVELAVFKVNEEIYVLNNTCPHQHTKVIYDGFIEEGCVVCPAHGWMFDLKTGKQPTGAKGLESYPIKIINDEVFVIVNKRALKW